jgi:hypothetical protein
MEMKTLQVLFTKINREFAEVHAAAQSAYNFGQLVPEIMKELKAETFQ